MREVPMHPPFPRANTPTCSIPAPERLLADTGRNGTVCAGDPTTYGSPGGGRWPGPPLSRASGSTSLAVIVPARGLQVRLRRGSLHAPVRILRILFAGLLLLLIGCSSAPEASSFSAGPIRDAAGSDAAGSVDASTDAGGCATPLADTGVWSLSDLLGSLPCNPNGLHKSLPCQGWIMVATTGGIDWGRYWIFNAQTGALVEEGFFNNSDTVCSAVPGFQSPAGCFAPAMWTDICPEGGVVEAGPDSGHDAAVDAPSDASSD